jgi:hypothetical protein
VGRIRSLRPEYRTDLAVAAWPRDVRLFFAYLKCYVDDFGRGIDEPRLIKADCFPVDDDVTADQVDQWLDLLANDAAVTRYQVDGRRYLLIPSAWWDQRPQHPTQSRIPAPPPTAPQPPPEQAPQEGPPAVPEPAHEAHRTGPVTVPEPYAGPHASKRRGEKRRGGGAGASAHQAPPDPEPVLRCPRHTGIDYPPSCGACADARRSHDAWQARQRARPTPGPPTHDCPRHPGQPARDCTTCRREATAPPADFSALRSARARPA